MSEVEVLNRLCGLCGLNLSLNPQEEAGSFPYDDLNKTIRICENCNDTVALLPLLDDKYFDYSDLPYEKEDYLSAAKALRAKTSQAKDIEGKMIYRGFGNRTPTGLMVECLTLISNYHDPSEDYSLIWIKTRSFTLYRLFEVTFKNFFKGNDDDLQQFMESLFKQATYFKYVLEKKSYPSFVFALDNFIGVFESLISIVAAVFPFDFSDE